MYVKVNNRRVRDIAFCLAMFHYSLQAKEVKVMVFRLVGKHFSKTISQLNGHHLRENLHSNHIVPLRTHLMYALLSVKKFDNYSSCLYMPFHSALTL